MESHEQPENTSEADQENQNSNSNEEISSPREQGHQLNLTENASREEDSPGIPVFTINAFGGTPVDDGSKIAPPTNASRFPSRAVSERPQEQDVLSVCSFGEEDDQKIDEDGTGDNEDHDLYGTSMF